MQHQKGSWLRNILFFSFFLFSYFSCLLSAVCLALYLRLIALHLCSKPTDRIKDQQRVTKESWKLQMSHWKGCFKLAVLVGLGLKWSHNSKDKKWLEGAEKDESTRPTPGACLGQAAGPGSWWGGMVFNQIKEKHPKPEWTLPESCRKIISEKTVDWWSCLKWGRREEALIHKHFNCRIVYSELS